MKYIMIGFLLSIGWTCGKSLSSVIAGMLLAAIEDSKWYQEVRIKKAEHIYESSDANVVKNQIGFR